MKCKNCGASLLDTDKFCDQCGWKVVRERRCPECGASLREGTKFCPKCGRLIGSGGSDGGKVFVRDSETSDIPIADIEQNILSETERELHTVKKARPASKPKKSVPAPEPKKKEKPAPVKKKVYEEWDDEEDEEDEDDDYTEPNVMVIATVVMALLIVLVAAVLFVKMKRPVKNYEESVEEEQVQDEEENGDGEDNGGTEPEESGGTDNEESDTVQSVGTLSIVSNVNVRDNPSTEGTNIIKVAKEGETYEYTGTAEDGNWYVILLEDGSTGYVFEKYVSVE